jgi:hypothetical protein
MKESNERDSEARLALRPAEAQLRAASLMGPIGVLSFGPYIAWWGVPKGLVPSTIEGALLFGAALVVGIFAHEALHGIGHLIGGAEREDLKFGVHWRAVTPYLECLTPHRQMYYGLAVGLPGIVLGAAPVVTGLVSGHWLTTFYGFVMLVSAAGDFVVLLTLVGAEEGAWVQDHPQNIGCMLIKGEGKGRPAPIKTVQNKNTSPTTKTSFRALTCASVVSALLTAAGFWAAIL